MASHNNFRMGDQRDRLWKLWVAFIPGSEKYKKIGPTFPYYNKYPDTEDSKEKLIKGCFTKYENQIQKAWLINNQTGEVIEILK